MEGVTPARSKVSLDPPDGKVHLGEPPGRVVELLSVDGNVVPSAPVRFDEPLGLDEHAARATARVIHPSLVRLDHLDEELDDTPWRVELASAFSFLRGEAAEEVLVHPAEEVLLPVLGSAKPKAGDQVNQLAKASDIEAWTGVVLRKHASKTRVLYLNSIHSRVDELPDLRLLRLRLEELPAGLWGDPEDALGRVLVSGLQEVVRVLARDPLLRQVSSEHCPALRKGIIDVLEEDETEDDVLVLARVHRPTELVRCPPQGVLEAKRLAVPALPRHHKGPPTTNALLGGRRLSQSMMRWYGNAIPGFRIQAGDAWAIGVTTRLDAPEYHGGLLQSVRG